MTTGRINQVSVDELTLRQTLTSIRHTNEWVKDLQQCLTKGQLTNTLRHKAPLTKSLASGRAWSKVLRSNKKLPKSSSNFHLSAFNKASGFSCRFIPWLFCSSSRSWLWSLAFRFALSESSAEESVKIQALGWQAVFSLFPSSEAEATSRINKTFLQIGTKKHRDTQSVLIQTLPNSPRASLTHARYSSEGNAP